MISAHIDEIGLVVRDIDPSGMIRFDKLGWFSDSFLPGTRVRVGKMPGMVGIKSGHLMTEEEKRTVLPHRSLYIDVGAKTAADVEKMGISIGDLFIGGVIPGVVIALFMMVQVYFVSLKHKLPLTPRPQVKVMFTSFQRAFLSLMTPAIIIGGIYSGLFSPTESGAVASVYAILLGLVIYRTMTGKDLLKVVRDSVEFTGILMLIMAFSALYGWLLVNVKIPQMVAEELMKVSTDPLILLFLINGFFLIVGCFMSVLVAVNILTPIFVPVIKSVGIDPVFFGVLMTITLSLGVCTPPFGNVLFVLAAITKQSFEEVSKQVLPYLLPILVVVVLCIFFPSIITFLPRLMH
jgi:tripartite ATP-independent transporter DctM subunit